MVEDQNGNKYEITEKIGTDGQGSIFATTEKNVIIRKSDRESDLARFEHTKLMPLSEIDTLLLPQAYLAAPDIGYVIHIPEGYMPLSSVMDSDDTGPSGGLKWRLGVLAAVAKVLIKLHGIPVMYGSMSPERIYVPTKIGEAALLYSAKMDYAMRFLEEYDWDPYVAPESMNGRGGTIKSDSYALGSLAYDLLAPEELGPNFRKLLDSTSLEPALRPSVSELYKALLQYSDMFVTCKKCLTDFYYYAEECPICAAPPPMMIQAAIYDQVAYNVYNRGVKIIEYASYSQYFFSYHTDNAIIGGNIDTDPRIECVIKATDDHNLHLTVKNLMDKEITVNNNLVASGDSTEVDMPCELVRINFPLYSETKRFIDMITV